MTGLTPEEHRVIQLLSEATGLYAEDIVGHAATRDADIKEWVARTHDLQARVLAQAAARAHPDLYRLAGETLRG